MLPALPQTDRLIARMEQDIENLNKNMGNPPRTDLATARGYIELHLQALRAIRDQMNAGRFTLN